MKKTVTLLAMILPLLLSACGNDDFHGRYTDQEGLTSYTFLANGEVHIVTGDNAITASYQYDANKQEIQLNAEQALPAEVAQVNDDGSIQLAAETLSRAVDESMLTNSTWKGNDGLYAFALTFSNSEAGLATFSELVSYDEDDKSYLYQTDDSITLLKGNKLLLDMTQYTVSDVTDNSMRISIGGQSMVMKKYPKGTKIEFRDGYQLAE